MSVTEMLREEFAGQTFTMQDAYRVAGGMAKAPSIRARIYEGLKNNVFLRLSKGVYATVCTSEDGTESDCILVHGDGRDLSFLKDGSVDAIITDHPYALRGALKGGNRDFASYELFQYTEKDFREKYRVLKEGAFLVEFLPEESAENFEYVTRVKQMAMEAGFIYYSKVPWQKGSFVANTGRKAKNAEDVMFFTKGKARSIRPDAKKDKAEPDKKHFMSGANGMLPAAINFDPPGKKERIHQAEKPLALLESIVKYVPRPGEWLLDQFAGSGVLGAACMNLGRHCLMVEKDDTAVENIAARLQMGRVEMATT